MMTLTDLYPARMRKTQATLTGATEAWMDEVKTHFSLLQSGATAPVVSKETFGHTLRLTKGLVEANVKYAQVVTRASIDLLGTLQKESPDKPVEVAAKGDPASPPPTGP